MIPRLIRFRDAPTYLGMDRNRFNLEVRPYLTEIPIGKQGLAFCRLELDAYAVHHMTANGRPAQKEGLWLVESHPASTSGAKSGGLTKQSTVDDFDAVRKLVTSK